MAEPGAPPYFPPYPPPASPPLLPPVEPPLRPPMQPPLRPPMQPPLNGPSAPPGHMHGDPALAYGLIGGLGGMVLLVAALCAAKWRRRATSPPRAGELEAIAKPRADLAP